MFCTNCGKELVGVLKFCPYCGQSVYNISEETVNKTEQIDEQTDECEEETVPVNPEMLNSTWAWVLAVVPLALDTILSSFGISDIYVSIIVIALNCIFWIVDTSYVKSVYTKSNGWTWLGFFVVPAYLIVRAIKTDKNYGYCIMWCVMFVISISTGIFSLLTNLIV